jgi:RNA recognition motif-containing protein
MNQSRQEVANDRQDLDSVPDSETKRPQTQLKSFNSDGGKLFVGGLSSGTTADTLRAHFSSFGEVVGASVIKDPATKRGRGFGFVEFDGGIPAAALNKEHVIDKRTCGVKPYKYEWSYVS